MSSNDTTEPEIKEENELSDYEKLRISNIKRNNAKLRQLGLISASEEERSNALAEGKGKIYVDNKDNTKVKSEEGSTEKKKKRKRQLVPTEGARKSLRLQGIGIDNEDCMKLTKIVKTENEIWKERVERVKECREVRLRAAKAIAEANAEQVAQDNPTATYEHCLMRVRTMTDKRLVTRVKVIERAAGKHCVVKMAIFKSCLQDEGKWDLSELASEALERLKSLKEPV